jgi:Holliday junction DNA helicase RuvA
LIHPGEKKEIMVPDSDFAEMVMNVLVNQLGYKSADAKRMVSEALEREPSIATPEALFDEVYRGEKNK